VRTIGDRSDHRCRMWPAASRDNVRRGGLSSHEDKGRGGSCACAHKKRRLLMQPPSFPRAGPAFRRGPCAAVAAFVLRPYASAVAAFGLRPYGVTVGAFGARPYGVTVGAFGARPYGVAIDAFSARPYGSAVGPSGRWPVGREVL